VNYVQTQMPQLEVFIDESIKRSAELGHVPTRFIQMRARYGTVVSINKLVPHSEEQSGFK
jgi:hypothetical protein